jgi:hypothetical protein
LANDGAHGVARPIQIFGYLDDPKHGIRSGRLVFDEGP